MAALSILLAAQTAAGVLNAPSFVWNDVRLARSMALWHGFSLYLDRDAIGAVIGTLHTPVSHCLYLAVAGFRSPTDALLAGSLLSLLLAFVPLGWVLIRASVGTRDRQFVATAAFLFCGFTIMQAPGTLHVACMIHTDAAALAFATLACGAFCNPRKPITVPQVWLAGVSCALAVGSKQTMAPIVMAIALLLGVAAGARLLVHFGAALLLSGAVLQGSVLILVPAHAFLFNTVTLAAHRPLKDGYIHLLVNSYKAGKQDALPALFPMLLLVGFQWIAADRRPALREFVLANRWLAFALCAGALIPVTAKAIVTAGSDVNHLGLVLYFLFVAAGLAIVQCLSYPGNAFVRGTAWMCVGIGILVSIAPGAAFSLPSRLRGVRQNAPEAALRYELRHPGRAYFPYTPLATLLASGRVYHVDFSVYDREIAGYPLTSHQFAAGLPSGFEVVAIPPGVSRRSSALRRMLERYAPVTDVELPGWTVYVARAPVPNATN
ncbi:MAG: hypothetical protein ABSH24_02400 [Bryobacteraceae bacterium]|jgi:hypothetical protein